jgi:hypothetical protein
MKSIKLLLSLLFVFALTNVKAQDDFYNGKKKKSKEKVEQTSKVNIQNVEHYTTEQDYNEKHNIHPKYEVVEEWSEEEIYDEDRDRKRRNNSIAAEVVAEVVVEVFINAAIIIATFWH